MFLCDNHPAVLVSREGSSGESKLTQDFNGCGSGFDKLP